MSYDDLTEAAEYQRCVAKFERMFKHRAELKEIIKAKYPEVWEYLCLEDEIRSYHC